MFNTVQSGAVSISVNRALSGFRRRPCPTLIVIDCLGRHLALNSPQSTCCTSLMRSFRKPDYCLVPSATAKMLSLVLSILVVAHAATALEYVEVFRDDFNGNNIDLSKWNVVDKPSTVNSELQYYHPDDVFQQDGVLHLRSQKREFGGRRFTAGRVDTKDKFDMLYGEVEWQAKMPKGKGLWPALWLLQFECPAAEPCGGKWPPEIDVMEYKGRVPNLITQTVHYGRWPNNAWDARDFVGPDFSADFHRFKVIWDPNQIVWFVDGVERFKVTDSWKIPHERMHLIMNLAVGGHWDGEPDDSTPFPNEFQIDWVTVHRWQ